MKKTKKQLELENQELKKALENLTDVEFLAKKLLEDLQPNTTIANCHLQGPKININWDKNSLNTIDKVAQGLLNLSQLFNSQQIVVKSMGIEISESKIEKINETEVNED